MQRGDVYLVDFGQPPGRVGSEQRGVRPAVVIQNDVGNRFAPTTVMAAMTSQPQKRPLPVNVSATREETGLPQDSVILLGQILTVDARRLGPFLVHLARPVMDKVDQALKVSLALS